MRLLFVNVSVERYAYSEQSTKQQSRKTTHERGAVMERKNAWKAFDEAALAELEVVSKGYIDFISECKTERECVARAIKMAEDNGYVSLDAIRSQNGSLKPGDKVWTDCYGKAIILVQVGQKPFEEGMNILGAHVDSSRLDIKQNPVYESSDFAYLDTHYYGGIKNYQWVTLPLAIHGVIAKTDGSVVEVTIGEDPADPVFCVTDLLPHLGNEQMKKTAQDVIEGESLDILAGNRPLVIDKEEAKAAAEKDDPSYGEQIKALSQKEAVKANLLSLLLQAYDMEEEDFLSAELEVVPAGRARECGFDRSMVLGYGQDDRVCAYTSLIAQLAVENPEHANVCILVDKEEIGSVGATGMTSRFFENTIAEVMSLAGEMNPLALRRCLASSAMLSSDVSAAFDPAYPQVYETKNTAYFGRGMVFNKFMGARGKSGGNDANAEYIAQLRRIMDEAGVHYQTGEIGRVNAGGGGTIAYILAEYGMNVIDSGVAVLSMHSPWEVTSKADIYEAYRGYKAFLNA